MKNVISVVCGAVGVVGVAWCSEMPNTNVYVLLYVGYAFGARGAAASIRPTKTLKFCFLHVFVFIHICVRSAIRFEYAACAAWLRIMRTHTWDMASSDTIQCLTHFKCKEKWNKNSNRQALKFTPIRVVHCGDWRALVCVRARMQVYFPKHWITLERSSI